MKKILFSLFGILLIMATASALPQDSYRSNWSMSWEDFSKKEQKIGLALGGGAVLGAAHIGVLKAIDELGIEIDYISGTSIGAFVAGLYANGLGWRDIQALSETLNWLDVSGLSFSNMGLLSNRKMGELIREKIGDVNLEDSDIPIAMIAADIETLEKVVLTKGSVAKAAMASTCVPGVFAPVEIDGRLLVDGGIVENVPISPLEAMGAEIIIAVDLNSEHKNKRPSNILEVLLRTFIATSETATQFQTRKADILITPDLSEFNVVEIDQSPDLIEKGYHEAIRILNEYFK
jgi:NTE family protein